MHEDTYIVKLDEAVVAMGMSLEHACLFAKALFDEYFNESQMIVHLIREPRIGD